MVAIGLIFTIVLGLCIVLCISHKLKLIEVLGLSFPVGMGIQSFLMVCLDLCNIKLTAPAVIITTSLLIVLLCVVIYFRRKKLQEWFACIIRFTFPKVNLLWLFCLLLLGVVIVMNLAKTMYFPTFDIDSIRGFNLIGMGIAHEGTIKNLSLFKDVNYSYEAIGSYYMYNTYVPLVQNSYAYVYMLGAETSKIINALFFVSFIPAFYGVLSRFATHTLTVLTTLFMTVTPEMLAFSSLSGTNYIHAIYASLGILFFVSWYYKKISSFLWLSALLLALNNWTRSEGVVFIGATCCVLLWYAIKEKQYKKLLVFTAICVFPILFWTLFLKTTHIGDVQAFIMKPFWDAEKAVTISKEVWILFNKVVYYGFTFILFFFVFLSNLWNIFKKRDQVITLLLIFLAIIFYSILIYQVDYIWDTLKNVLLYSYKRFLFAFVPLLWFYIAANKNMKWIFEKIDNFIFPTNPKVLKKKR